MPETIAADIIDALDRRQQNGLDCIPILDQCAVRSLPGGLNNAAYAFDHAGTTYCLKLYRNDDRRRAEREWTALNFLHDRGSRIAPQPLWHNADPRNAAIVMEYIAGTDLRSHTPSAMQMRALSATLRELHAITPHHAAYPHEVIGPPHALLARMESWLHASADHPDALIAQARTLVLAWWHTDDRAILLQAAPAVFDRGDPSLANCLWTGDRIRCVDLEYAGWSDRAYMLGHLVEGPWSWHIAEQAWRELFIAEEQADRAMQQRFRAARRMAAHFWLYKFAEQRANTIIDDQLATQIDRTRRMHAGR